MQIIRRLNANDLPEFFEHRLEGLKNVPSAFGANYVDEKANGLARFESVLKDTAESNIIFGAFVNNSLVGTIGIKRETGANSRHKTYIWGMYVKPAFGGKGIGKELVQAAIVHARSLSGVVLIDLSVEATNDQAKRLYASFGFKIWGNQPRALYINGTYFDEEHMQLDL